MLYKMTKMLGRCLIIAIQQIKTPSKALCGKYSFVIHYQTKGKPKMKPLKPKLKAVILPLGLRRNKSVLIKSVFFYACARKDGVQQNFIKTWYLSFDLWFAYGKSSTIRINPRPVGRILILALMFRVITDSDPFSILDYAPIISSIQYTTIDVENSTTLCKCRKIRIHGL